MRARTGARAPAHLPRENRQLGPKTRQIGDRFRARAVRSAPDGVRVEAEPPHRVKHRSVPGQADRGAPSGCLDRSQDVDQHALRAAEIAELIQRENSHDRAVARTKK
jgi:hypothetical protein